uniref:Uncharacterized protein n=1 Tax=Steinernema glaseri TaxID=37863 RepID=A0A1I7YC02_9BILA
MEQAVSATVPHDGCIGPNSMNCKDQMTRRPGCACLLQKRARLPESLRKPVHCLIASHPTHASDSFLLFRRRAGHEEKQKTLFTSDTPGMICSGLDRCTGSHFAAII